MNEKMVVIFVAGQKFSLRTDDPEQYLLKIGEKVDVRIRGIQKDNQRLNRDACATLAALEYCDRSARLAEQIEKLRGQIKDYLDDRDTLSGENERLKAEIERLKSNKPVQQSAGGQAQQGKPQGGFSGNASQQRPQAQQNPQNPQGYRNTQNPQRPSAPSGQNGLPRQLSFLDDKN